MAFDTPYHSLAASEELWIASTVIAFHRMKTRFDKLSDIDMHLQNSFGTVMAVAIADATFGNDNVSHDILNSDIFYCEGNRIFNLEASSLMVDGYSKSFLVHKDKFYNSREKSVSDYIPVLTAKGASVSHLGKSISMSSIVSWTKEDDDNLKREFGKLSNESFSHSFSSILRSLEDTPHLEAIEEAIKVLTNHYDAMKNNIVELFSDDNQLFPDKTSEEGVKKSLVEVINDINMLVYLHSDDKKVANSPSIK